MPTVTHSATVLGPPKAGELKTPVSNAPTMPPTPCIDVIPKAAVGRSATEAPRGLLFHRYNMDESGIITGARIIPPTSQNQLSIEEDLRQAVPLRIHEAEDDLRVFCEQTIRNYDPCISCATHFLKIHRMDTSKPPEPR